MILLSNMHKLNLHKLKIEIVFIRSAKVELYCIIFMEQLSHCFIIFE